jgi:hypothetical protein
MDENMDMMEETVRHHDLMELFEELSFREKVRKVIRGLGQPKDSGEYKYARLQILRLSAPLSAIVVPCLALALLLAFAGMRPPPPRAVEITIMEPEALEELEKVEEIEEPIEPPEPIEMDFTPDMAMSIEAPSMVNAPATDFSPQPAEFDTVAIVKSPVVMKGIFGSRNPGARGQALANYGGNAATEGAVMRALRWLKKNQNSDGSWNKTKPAATSMALLAYLAHGETPSSEEFGETVEKAIRWLVDNQDSGGRFKGRDNHDYSQPIAAYALAEAYGITRVPMLKEVAEKAVDVVVRGQNPSGGFNYNLKPSQRNDTSYMGWCAQALKAAYMAGLENDGLRQSMNRAVAGFKLNADPGGGFGYSSPKAGGLTGVGVLCMQLLGHASDNACKKGLADLADATFNWDGSGKYNKNYYWYYITQAKFHAGPEAWQPWNRVFAPTLVENQTVIKDGIADANGNMVDIGYWNMSKTLSGHTDGDVMNTALACLQLEVYYRYLPTFKPPEELQEETLAEDEGDIQVDIQI